MSKEARDYFNTRKPDREPKYLTVFGWLFSFNWSTDQWTDITDSDTEITNYFSICKRRNMKNQTCYSFIFWNLSIIAGKIQ